MVEYIEYKGEKLPFLVSYAALSQWEKETGKNFTQIDEAFQQITLLEPLFYYALVSGHRFEDKELKIKREDCQYILDVCWIDFSQKAGNFFSKNNQNSEGNSKKK